MSIYVSLVSTCLQLQRGTASRCIGPAESRLIRALPADRTWRQTRMPFGFEDLPSHAIPVSLRAGDGAKAAVSAVRERQTNAACGSENRTEMAV